MVVGIMAAIMGVGGGFITFPLFVYIFGVSSMTTVGTDILQIIFTAGLAAIGQYAIYGYVFYTLAMGMLIGSLLGIQVGRPDHRSSKAFTFEGSTPFPFSPGSSTAPQPSPRSLPSSRCWTCPSPL